jgi:hypothetical protein
MTIPYKYFRIWHTDKYIIMFRQKSKNNDEGRFGGGWQFKIGFAFGKDSFVLFLGVAYLTITRRNDAEIPF